MAVSQELYTQKEFNVEKSLKTRFGASSHQSQDYFYNRAYIAKFLKEICDLLTEKNIYALLAKAPEAKTILQKNQRADSLFTNNAYSVSEKKIVTDPATLLKFLNNLYNDVIPSLFDNRYDGNGFNIIHRDIDATSWQSSRMQTFASHGKTLIANMLKTKKLRISADEKSEELEAAGIIGLYGLSKIAELMLTKKNDFKLNQADIQMLEDVQDLNEMYFAQAYIYPPAVEQNLRFLETYFNTPHSLEFGKTGKIKTIWDLPEDLDFSRENDLGEETMVFSRI